MTDKKLKNTIIQNKKVGSTPSRVWLYLLENGRSELSELCKALDLGTSVVAACLQGLVEAGTVQRYEKVKGGEVNRLQFGVTNQCTVPGGVLMSDLLSAVTLNPANSAVITSQENQNAE